MGISTHILDTTRGRPASGVAVALEVKDGAAFRQIATGQTDADGRVKPLIADVPSAGTYRIRFEVGPYFTSHNVDAFFPSVSIDFTVKNAAEHYHVPLLLNPFGFSTYRGS